MDDSVTTITGNDYTQRMAAIHQLEDQLVATPAQHTMLELAMATATSLEFTRGVMPVWLVFEGDASTGKTFTTKLLKEYDCMVYRGKVTAAGFSSGYVDARHPRGVKGLLHELDQKCLVLTELGQRFSINTSDLKKLMGRFAAMYDGENDDQVGTQEYEGSLVAHFSMLACGTPSTLASHRAAMAAIGPRFLYYRLLTVSRDKKRRRREALKLLTGATAKAEALRERIAEHLRSLPPVPDELPPWPDEIGDMVDFLT